MSRLFIDGYEWVEADYMTVNKDLHVKGDFILDGGGSLAFDAIITGSLKVNGPTLGSFGSFTRITGWTDGIGTVKKTVGSFGVLAVGGQSRLHGALYGSLGSFSRLTIKGSAYGRTFYGSLGSFTRVPLINLNLMGAAPALVKSFVGDTNGTLVVEEDAQADGSWVYISDHGRNPVLPTVRRIQKRQKSDWAFVAQFASALWDITGMSLEHLNGVGERGSVIYALYDNLVDGATGGIKKIRTSDMGLDKELRGSYQRVDTTYDTLYGGILGGIQVHGGSVYVGDAARVLKFNRGLTVGTVLIGNEKFGTETNTRWPYIYGLTTNGTNIFLTTSSDRSYGANVNRIRRYDMLGSEIERTASIPNYPDKLVWNKGYLHMANSGQQRIEKWQPAPLSKVMQFTVGLTPQGLAADGTWYWVAESWYPSSQTEQWTMGAGNITGAALVVTAGSFETVVGHLGRFHGTVTVDKAGSFGKEVRAGTFRASKGSFITVAAKGTIRASMIRASRFEGTYKKLVQAGSATPGSAGYIVFPESYANAGPFAVLTQKDPWVPSIAYGPRIKTVDSSGITAFGSPGGYLLWQALGSAF